jgi:hypothetical protein
MCPRGEEEEEDGFVVKEKSRHEFMRVEISVSG